MNIHQSIDLSNCSKSVKKLAATISNVNRYLSRLNCININESHIERISEDKIESVWKFLSDYQKAFCSECNNNIVTGKITPFHVKVYAVFYYMKKGELWTFMSSIDSALSNRNNIFDVMQSFPLIFSEENYILNINKFDVVLKGANLDGADALKPTQDGSMLIMDLWANNHLDIGFMSRLAPVIDERRIHFEKNGTRFNDDFIENLKILLILHLILKGE